MLSMLAGLARAKIIAVVAGVAGFGVIGVVDNAVAFLTHLGSLSVPTAATRFLPTRRAESDDAFRTLYRALARTLIAASVVTTLIAIAIAVWRPTVFGDELAGYRAVIVVALLGVPVAAFLPFLRSVMALLGKHRGAAMSVFLTSVGLVISSFVGLRLAGLSGLYAGNLLVLLPAALLMRGSLRHTLPAGSGGEGGALETLRHEKGLVLFCTAMHLLTLAAPLAYLYARLRVFTLHGEEAAGLLAAAFGLAIAVRVVLHQGNALYLAPLVNQPTARAVRSAAAGEYLHTLSVLLVLASLAVVLFPKELLVLLYSPQFLGAAPFVAPFLIGELIMLASAVLQAVLIGFDDLRSQLTNSVAGQLVVVGLVYFLVPARGVMGAAVAIIVGHSVILMLNALRLMRSHHAASVVRTLPLLVIGISTLAAIAWWVIAASPALAWKLLAWVLVGALFVTRLRADERRRLLGPWRAFIGG
jgi:PST family polysaccharide transporter